MSPLRLRTKLPHSPPNKKRNHAKKQIFIPAPFMCGRSIISKFCYSDWSGDVQNLAPPWWLPSKRHLAPPATPRFNVGVISNRLTWSELTTQHWNKGVRGGLCLAMAVNLMIKKKNFDPDCHQEQNKSHLWALEPGIQVHTLGHAYEHDPTWKQAK